MQNIKKDFAYVTLNYFATRWIVLYLYGVNTEEIWMKIWE